jgi:hypothetical protein
VKLLQARDGRDDSRSANVMPLRAIDILAGRSPAWEVGFRFERRELIVIGDGIDLAALSVETITPQILVRSQLYARLVVGDQPDRWEGLIAAKSGRGCNLNRSLQLALRGPLGVLAIRTACAKACIAARERGPVHLASPDGRAAIGP